MTDIAAQLAAYAGPPIEVFYADPPWKFRANRPNATPRDLAHGRNASRHYKVMPLADICALPVKQIAAKQSACVLWITGPFLAIGAHVRVLEAWGFKPKAVMFTWGKLRKNSPGLFFDPKADLHLGLGLTTRKNAEFAILGTRGKSMRISKSVPEFGLFPIREHSRKPDEYRDRLEAYFGPDRIKAELFARTAPPGWLAFGNEVGKF